MSIFKHRVNLVFLFLFIISLCIALTINFYPLYAWDIHYLDLVKDSGFSKEVIVKNYHQLMNYLNFPWVTHLHMTDFPVSASGRTHFEDVKKLFLLDYALLILTAFPALAYLRKLKSVDGLWRLIRPFKIAVLVPIGFLFVMLIGFERFFILFHEVLFSNDAWVFDPSTDPIILVLPETYFLHCFLLAFALIEASFLGVLWLIRRDYRKIK